ncbi:hypothetical protein LB505_000496 [Fusarium chuoi]|nr:hypothetical protein LB505_000496 [Fusarium chuoi]
MADEVYDGAIGIDLDEGDCRDQARQEGREGRHHCPCLLQRQPATSHQGRRFHCRSQRPPYHQRAHCRRHCLRSWCR